MLPIIIISLSLLGISGLLIDWHRRSWREARQSTKLAERDKRFARSMYRRRMQASATIGVIGAGIAVGPIVPRQPGPLTLYLAMLLAGSLWIMLLAMFDVWATRLYYQRLRTEQTAKQIQLARELAKMNESSEAEGHAQHAS